MERHDVPLLVHGEVTDADVDIFDREAVFIDRHLAPLVEGGYASAFDNAHELATNFENLRVAGDKYFFYGRKADLAPIVRLG
jgi:hypothetical protein